MPDASGAAKAGIADTPLVIIVSCKDGSALDAGLVTQNMSAEAQLLGYGTKIIASPTIALNGEKQTEYRELLGIPDDMSAVCMLLIGKTDAEAYDAVSGPLRETAWKKSSLICSNIIKTVNGMCIYPVLGFLSTTLSLPYS